MPRPPESTSPKEMFSNENYLDELQDTELKRTLINFINESRSLKKAQRDVFLHT